MLIKTIGSTAKKPLVIGKKTIAALLIGGIVTLVAANVLIFTNFKTTSSLSFSGAAVTSAFDSDLVLVIGNDRPAGSIINIYAYNYEPNINFSKTDLTEVNSGIKIPSQSIELNTAALSNNITPQNPMLVTFLVAGETVQAGLYHGALFVTSVDTTASIPITYDVKPDFSRPIILVVDGIVISIALWKLITYFNTKYHVVIKAQMAQGVTGTFSRVDPSQNIWQYLAESSKKPIIIKNLILDVGTIIFGIGLGVVGLLTNQFLTDLYNINEIDVIILISIGLGIGSLKEFVAKQV